MQCVINQECKYVREHPLLRSSLLNHTQKEKHLNFFTHSCESKTHTCKKFTNTRLPDTANYANDFLTQIQIKGN